MRRLILLVFFITCAGAVHAQTETPTPAFTPSPTPSPTPDVIAYMQVQLTEENSQAVAVSYSVNAGEFLIALLLAAILFTAWAIFFVFLVLGVLRGGDSRPAPARSPDPFADSDHSRLSVDDDRHKANRR